MIFGCIALLLAGMSITGCKGKEHKKTQIVLTTDFDDGEVFRIEGISGMQSEILVYLVNSENQYNRIFGSEIWKVPIKDTTVEAEYKETILARLAQIKVMNLLAEEKGIELDKEEEALCKQAAETYFSSLSLREQALLGVTEESVCEMYREFKLANKLYHDITDTINPEISDDEARTITVKSILIKTYRTNSIGQKLVYNQQEKQEAYNRAFMVKKQLEEGISFDVLAADYNEDTQSEYSFGRGVMPENYEQVAFSLETNQISDIIETEYGYHILQCVSTFDQGQTDANKIVIVEKRKQEAFNNEYEQFVKNLTSNLNADLWESITYEQQEGIETTSFFDIYNELLGDVSG